MTRFQAVGDEVDIQSLLFLDICSHRLSIRIFNIGVSDTIHKVLNDLVLDVELVLQAVFEQRNWNESMVTRIKLLQLLIYLANYFPLIKLLCVLEEGRRQAKERRVEHLVNRFELET